MNIPYFEIAMDKASLFLHREAFIIDNVNTHVVFNPKFYFKMEVSI